MRRLTRHPLLCAFIVLLAIAPSACKRKARGKNPEGQLLPDPGPLVSVVHVNDAAVSGQLVRGFYELESNTWRWSMRNFTVALKPPPGAAQNGARLGLQFTIPEIIANQVGSMSVRAVINGLPLPPATYSKPGEYIYSRDVPATALSGDAVIVDFSCDKSVSPPGDVRELALIVLSIGLERK